MWLGTKIPVDDMLIRRIIVFHCQGANPVDAFFRKSQGNKLADQMKNNFGFVKKSWGYAISSSSDLTVHFSAHILAGEIMRKCQADEVLAPIVSLVVQCSKGVYFNWVWYLCQEFLDECQEVQEDGK